MKDKHIPVLLQEVIQYLNPKPGQNYIDATLGFGGHSEAILKKTSPGGRLLGIDQDDEALNSASERLAGFGERFSSKHGNFSELSNLLPGFPITGGILADIGVSSVQFDEMDRGFSFKGGPLDMRMDKSAELSAYEIVNKWSEEKLAKIISEYGEERFSSRIARQITETREQKYIETTDELAEIIANAIPRRFWPRGINPATKTFQAIRIAVNDELGALKRFLPQAVDALEPGARLAIISFHSLEDRIVKDYFRERANPCTCPPQFPKCVCGKVGDIRLITKKPITATDKEIEDNPRSRSAKLRVIEKIKK
jgi:16S rRNA (cytosine1402-N4)-methyltransferase